MNTKIIYKLTEEGRRKSLLSGGDGKERQEVFTDSKEALKIAEIDADGNATIDLCSTPYSRESKIDINEETGRVLLEEYYVRDNRFDAPQTSDVLLAAAIKTLAEKQNKKHEYEKLKKEYEPVAQKYAEKIKLEREQEELSRKEKEIESENKRKAKEEEKNDWINKHGSDHLRDAVKLGYDCQRKYVTERAALEFPNFTVDFDDNADYKTRSCPSPEAIKIIKKYKSENKHVIAIWLTRPIAEEDKFEEQEALCVQIFLGKYDLIMTL